jgi:peroxiredoxin
MNSLPAVPLTVEGASVLHQMMRVKWHQWHSLPPGTRDGLIREAERVLAPMENSAIYSMLGHKGDLMFVHFRNSFDELNATELTIERLGLAEYLEETTSYLSVVELGLYESSQKTYAALAERGLEPFSEAWNAEIAAVLDRQREAMHPRLYPAIPPHRYICFYPMDRKRGEDKNWYMVPMAERARMMEEHGRIGRRYAGQVKQIITGSIGFDDWEWGVDLFSEDPLVFKRLIYEMRFDEVSAVYALFGSFYVGLRVPVDSLGSILNG